MESAKDRLDIGIALLEKAVKTLSDALKEELTGYIRDAVIQRFEYTFEYEKRAQSPPVRVGLASGTKLCIHYLAEVKNPCP